LWAKKPLLVLVVVLLISPIAWSGAEAQPSHMLFTGWFYAASYHNPSDYDLQAMQADLNMLYSAGVNSIRADIGSGPWLKNNQTIISNLESSLSGVRAAGKTVIIADAGCECYYSNPEPWSQFKTDWVTRVTTIAQAFHPDFYLVIKEPGWYVRMVSDATTNADFQNPASWDTLAGQLAAAVQSVSPNTVVGVSVDAGGSMTNQASFYDSFLSGLPSSISIIGFDIYGAQGYTNTLDYLGAHGADGRQVWIAETWSSPTPNAADAQSDATWLEKTLYPFASSMGATEIQPFYSNAFVSYSTVPTTSSGLISFYASTPPFTPVYYAYQGLISNASSVATTSTTASQTSSISQTSPTSQTSTSQSTVSTTSTSSSAKERGGPPGGSPRATLVLLTFAALAVIAVVLVAFALLRRRRR
jgi:hypothetical protein